MTLAEAKDAAAILQSVGTFAALAVGGWWSFLLFVRKREKFPRARTTHSLTEVAETSDRRLVRLSVKIENLGNVLIGLSKASVRVQAMNPLRADWVPLISEDALERTAEHEFQWPVIEDFSLTWGKQGYRVEPQESEEFHFDISLREEVKAVQVYSYFQNISERKRELGWNCTSVQFLRRGDEDGEDTDKPSAKAEIGPA